MFVFVIKIIREKKNISLNQLHIKTNISYSYLSELENNKKFNPTLDILSRIAQVLEINVKNLFYTELDIDELKEEMYKRIDEFGINSKEALETSQIIDLLINDKMEENKKESWLNQLSIRFLQPPYIF